MPSSTTSRIHTPPSPSFSDITPSPYCTDPSPTDTVRDEDKVMALYQPDTVLAEEVLPGEMSTATGEDVELQVDDLTEPNRKRTTELEIHTTQSRKSSRQDIESATVEDSGVENLQHNSPGSGEQIEPPERDSNAPDPTEGMTVAKREATPCTDRTRSPERRKEAQIAGEDLAEPKPEATPSRIQAGWVTEAVAACQANKKVRRQMLPIHDKH